ncbi:hypothetical protein HJFPF1_02271 [Paramyrothecium foliicola]|nr:hypothetical protein HJFPF1_02271 [Paramyrothecium foliicola]
MFSPTKSKQSIKASIELTDPQLAYVPGAHLSGAVKRVQIDGRPEAITVDLSLVCRIRTRITHTNMGDKSDDHYHADTNIYTRKTRLYAGPVVQGINSWAFAVNLPATVEAQNKERGRIQVDAPQSYYKEGWEYLDRGRRDWLYCEWYLLAEVNDLNKRREKPKVSTLPIFVQSPSAPASMQNAQTLSATYDEHVKTLHLNPEQSGQSLSFKQRFQTVFQRSTLPQYGYTIIVEHPSHLEIDSPEIIPFRIAALPDASKTNIPFLLEKPPALTLSGLEIILQSSTQASHLDGSIWAVDTTSRFTDLSTLSWKSVDTAADPVIPYRHNQCSALDVGSTYRLLLSWEGLEHILPRKRSWGDVSETQQAWPSSEGYYLSHRHRLSWTLKVTCAGKTSKIRGDTPVTIVGPSEYQYRQYVRELSQQDRLSAHKAWTENVLWVPWRSKSQGLETVHASAGATSEKS